MQLIWEVFFASKLRGVSLHAHFPWIAYPDDKTWFVVLYDQQTVIGGLVVRHPANQRLDEPHEVAMIGLVCIEAKYRGQGYARAILEYAIGEAKERGYHALTLWTQKPKVYIPHGFTLFDNAIFGSIDTSEVVDSEAHSGSFCESIVRSGFPQELALPAFAINGSVLATPDAKVVLIETPSECIVGSWSGHDLEVSKLLESMPEKKWMINAYEGDCLLDVLEARGAKINVNLCNLQMWLPLNDEFIGENWTTTLRFSVFDRI